MQLDYQEILLVPTGEIRLPLRGEWFRDGKKFLQAVCDLDVEREIYNIKVEDRSEN